jgi:hypothetical protein
MKPAPPFDCARCGRRIAKRGIHHLIDGTRTVVCGRCLSKDTHAALFPDCPKQWHDMLDHDASCGTRAGIAAVLGLWP